ASSRRSRSATIAGRSGFRTAGRSTRSSSRRAGSRAASTCSSNACPSRRGDARGVYVLVDGVAIPARLRQAGRDAAKASGGPRGAGNVTAPMPGKVVKVLVTVGQPVTARQGVAVIEAMKMENELRAGRDGTLRAVLVAERALVDAGATLVVIE